MKATCPESGNASSGLTHGETERDSRKSADGNSAGEELDGTDGASSVEERTATVDLVIPVHNEERSLPGCVEVLNGHLVDFPFQCSITVVDNASTDETLRVAHNLASSFDHVRVLHLDRKGRGRALRAAWSGSDADIVAYMDVDLSTGLDALLPLVAALVNGHSDLTVGTRLAPGARTVRTGKRELISRCYNKVTRWTHGARFSDAQCGFKAARTSVIRPLLERVRDESWFFDTELLLLAEHNGLRVHEIPVDWVEDVDTRVNIARTALDDLTGLVRVARAKVTGAARVPDLPRRPEPRAAHPEAALARRENGLLWQIVSFGAIGGLSTLATSVLYAVLRGWFPALIANLIALTVTTLWNTEVNRRFTFVRGSGSSSRIHLQGLVVFALYYAITSGALLGLGIWHPNPSRWLEVIVLIVSSVVGTALRFVLLRSWVFREPSRAHSTPTHSSEERPTP